MSKRQLRQHKVVQFRQGKAEPPVYFICAGPGEFRLAELMGGRHPIFGIQVPWPLAWRDAAANDQTSTFPRMEQLVAPYVAALSCHIHSSSCVLAGYSFAGVMAFEVAHQFQRQGGNVNMVMLFDTWIKRPTAREVAWHKWRQEWRQKQAPKRISTDQLSQSIGSRLRNSWLVARWMLEQEARTVFRPLLPKPSELSTILDEQGVPVALTLVHRLYAKILELVPPAPPRQSGYPFSVRTTR